MTQLARESLREFIIELVDIAVQPDGLQQLRREFAETMSEIEDTSQWPASRLVADLIENHISWLSI